MHRACRATVRGVGASGGAGTWGHGRIDVSGAPVVGMLVGASGIERGRVGRRGGNGRVGVGACGRDGASGRVDVGTPGAWHGVLALPRGAACWYWRWRGVQHGP
jgi:hypothetical protein